MQSSTGTIASKPSLVEWDKMRFIIMDSPKDSNIHLYLRELKKYNTTHLVRIAEPSYNKQEVENAGITVHVSTLFDVVWTFFYEFGTATVSRRCILKTVLVHPMI